jgi:RAQPRD family integrative conjugative element protein
MKNLFLTGLSAILLMLISNMALASETMEKVYLQQVLNQLNEMQSLIEAASREQPQNVRIQFHYARYTDARGRWHNGLLEDVRAIKQGIEEKLNQPMMEPRTVMPIKGDYIESSKAKN